MYEILPYTKDRARVLGVVVLPSKTGNYKIDIFDKKMKTYLGSVGDVRYNDYPHYILSHGKKYADERRRLYKIRHEADRHKVGSAGFWADRLLW